MYKLICKRCGGEYFQEYLFGSDVGCPWCKLSLLEETPELEKLYEEKQKLEQRLKEITNELSGGGDA